MKIQDLKKLTTEARHPETTALDQMTPIEILTIMNREDRRAAEAVERMLPKIARVVDFCVQSLERGGRIVYMGAGTSGRLGVLDAVECPPTFGVEPECVVGLMAGGEKAFVRAVENAEDSETLGREDLSAIGLGPEDTVIGIAASGRTPYVIHGMRYARSLGCRVAAVVCNRESAMAEEADVAIELVTGPEVLTGSTRLKAGTAQKMTLNMISTASMVGVGKVYENLMVDVRCSNHKLETRAENIVMDATGCGRARARAALAENRGRAKPAIVQILLDCEPGQAQKALREAKGHVREAVKA